MRLFLGYTTNVLAAAGLSIVFSHAALAQSNSSSSSASNPPAASSGNGSTMALGDKAPSGSLVKSSGDWRSSEIVGATVYNDQGDSVGTVNDLLVSPDGTVSKAVLSVGGFLGLGSKLVEVPFNSLKFVPSQSNPASGSKTATQSATGAPPAAGTLQPTAGGTAAPSAASGSASTMAPAATPGATGAGNGATGSAGTTTAASGAPAPAAASGTNEFSLVLPGATKQSLTSASTFKFAD